MASDLESTTDVHCVDDFLPNMPTVSGSTALVQRLARRLSTKRGSFTFWPDFGFDLLGALLSKAKPQFIETQALMECKKEEQVDTCTTTLRDLGGNSYALDVGVTTAEGPFDFTMEISTAKKELTVKIQESS